jgi:hypothetical protein
MDEMLFRHDQLNVEPSVPTITKVDQIVVEVRICLLLGKQPSVGVKAEYSIIG